MADSITVPVRGGGTISVPIPPMVATTDWQSILAIQAATAAAYVQRKNAELQAGYDAAIAAYNAMMASGSFPVVHAPTAPLSFVFVPADQTGTGMPSYEQSGPPVIGTIPLAAVNNALNPPPNTAPGVMMIGERIAGTNVYQALKGDTMPEGATKTIPGPDGTPITVRKHNVPWGGYWEVVG